MLKGTLQNGLFAQSLRYAQNLILGISNICLRLNFSHALILNENSHFSRHPLFLERINRTIHQILLYQLQLLLQGKSSKFTDKGNLLLFHAGTASQEGGVVTAGGRVLGVTALAGELPQAISLAYEGVRRVYFEGMYYRRDIGHRALRAP